MTSNKRRAVAYTGVGGPEYVGLIDQTVPTPGEGEVLIRVLRAGVNAADMMLLNTGLNLFTGENAAQVSGPVVPGGEVMGIREDTGERVVALCGAGGYAEWIAVPKLRVMPVPDHASDADALTLVASGLTAWFLVDAGRVAPGDSVVVTGAAGAIGSIAVQLAVARGARRVIGLASTPQKRTYVTDLGAHAVTDSSPDGLQERLLEANGGAPVNVVFDMVGGKVFEAARAALARFGRIVVFAAASGESTTLETTSLAFGSHTVSGVWLQDYVEAGLVGLAMDRLFDLHKRGAIRTPLEKSFRLDQVLEAQDAFADRTIVGKVQIEVSAG
jgi:NADPH2:quinone reductase